MSFKWYHLATALCAALLFVTPAKAASTATVSGTSTTADNDTITVRGYTLNALEMTTENQTDFGYIQNWDIVQNYRLQLPSSGYYYTGVFSFTATITPSIPMERTNPVLIDSSSDGLRFYINSITSTSYSVTIIFDNYFASTVNIGIPTITQTFTLSNVDPVSYPTTANFTLSFSGLTGSLLRKQSTPFNNGLAGIIAQSIDNSIKIDMIMGYLYDIRENDYDYYTGLSAQIASLISAQNTANARLQSILNEIDIDFAAVQTVLDLFPSYRTQVLQYWQQLLEMNAAQSSAAADIESQYADRDNQSETLLSGLGDINFPTVSAGDLNVLQNVDQNTKTDFFGLISLITNNGLITNILLIAVTAMIAGFALYGKKH